MVTFSIPCWLFWYVTGGLTTLIILIGYAIVAGAKGRWKKDV